MSVVDQPPTVIRGYWCPLCGRFELTYQAWHVRASSISERCEQAVMSPIRYVRQGDDPR